MAVPRINLEQWQALVAVVEAGLDRGPAAPAAATPAPAPASPRALTLLVLLGTVATATGILVPLGPVAPTGILGLLGLVLLGCELLLARRGLDLGLDLVTQVDLGALILGIELVAAAELSQLRGRDLELVCDPCVGAPLADVQISVDGTPLPALLLGEDWPVDPGSHEVAGARGSERVKEAEPQEDEDT